MTKIICILFTVALLAAVKGTHSTTTPKPAEETTPLVIHTAEGYHTINECDGENECPGNRNTVCRLDCMIINGRYGDCIYHFYDKSTGQPFYHCWE